MKKLLYRIIKIFLLTLLCLICLFSGTILFFYINSFDEFTRQKIKSDPAVSDVRLSTDKFVNPLYNMKITFIGGGRIGAYYMDKSGKDIEGRSMSIHIIDEYYISFFNRTEKKRVSPNLEAWSAVTGIQLESIIDVVKNYPVIREEVESWTDLSNYKQDGEVIHETRSRVTALNQYSDTVIINGQEIVLLKYPLSLNWSLYYNKESYERAQEWLEKF